ncbi:MAG: molybdopterin cofactor-binding domain-containing protein, partial [Myxococcota bacterium]|nr:molybdopterin cofactor-binding domain-containing protein [Myxococcota bacterium]
MELPTVGSMSVEHSGTAVRLAAAEARQLLLEEAARRLGAPVAALEVEDGVVRRRGASDGVGYGALQGGRPFGRRITGEALPKPAAAHRIVGRPGPRPDLRAKLTGGAFLHDLRLPDMLFGRVLRPPAEAAELEAVETDPVRRLPGVVAVVRDGRFLGVVAEREEQAERAVARLADACRWRVPATLPEDGDWLAWLRAQPRESFPVVDGTPEDRPVPPHEDPPDAARTRAASYARPLLMHGSIGPSAAIARWRDGALRVWSHSQGVAMLRLALAEVLELAPEAVRVTHAEGPGCYGHNGADDVALDAALLARAAPGRPVQVQWSRQDEHAWEPYGPASVVDLRASLDAQGRIVDWSHEATSLTHVGRPMPGGEGSQLLAAWHLARPRPRPRPRARLAPEVGVHRNAWPAYALPRVRVVKHLVPSRTFRTSSLRSLGAFANVFAIESFVDELAHAAGVDPLAFRLRHLEEPRARAVLEAAAGALGWRRAGGDGRGQGLAFARYANAKAWAAVAVELDVDEGGRIHLRRAVVAADA